MLTKPESEPLAIKTGNRLREIRIAKCITMKPLAEQLGTSVQTVSRLEKGGMTLSVEWIEKFCAALDIHPGVLFVDDAFRQQVEHDRICSEVLTLQFQMQRATGRMAEFLKTNGWPS
jgi:transcriptional regulator with XRE-family HTH domain